MSVVDQYSDPAFATLYRQVTAYPRLEDYIKEASLDAGEAEALPKTAFAWPDERKFPMHTAAHAAMSYAYVKAAAYVPEHVMRTLQNALAAYDISEDVFVSSATKVAADNENDYLVPSLKLWAVKTASDVKVAERHVMASLTRLDLPHRTLACTNLVKKAAEYGVPVSLDIQRGAGLVVSDLGRTRDWVEARANAVDGDSFKTAYLKLAEGLRHYGAESNDRDGLMKIAGAIAELDERSGLDRHYDRKLPDAVQTVFNTSKLASETVDLAGKSVPVSKLAALPVSFWEDLGGPDLRSEVAPGGSVVDVSKLAMVVDTLPLDLKIILRNQVR
jgi:hypothetical protein